MRKAGGEAVWTWERPEAGAALAARILLLAPHFPPGAEAGSQRWLALAGHAAERGFGLDVATVAPSSLANPDFERLERLPPGTRVVGIERVEFAFERAEAAIHRARARRRSTASAGTAPGRTNADGRPTSLARREIAFRPGTARSWTRSYTALLELRRERRWGLRAAAALRSWLVRGRHACVVACSPPHGIHEGARRLAQSADLPFVMDLRDPWTLTERLPEPLASPLWYRLGSRDESRCVADAALVVMNSAAARDAMRDRHPGAADRIVAVPNGCDDEPLPPAERDPRFLVAYAGTLYLDRDPTPVLRAAARLVRRRGLRPEEFGIEFMGETVGRDPLAAAREAGIGDFVHLHPPASRGQAAAFLGRASLLVDLHQDSRLAIPSKLFEYMRYEAWLLALCVPGSATHALLEGTSADRVGPDDIDAIEAALERRYDERTAGLRPTPLATDPRFSRRLQAERLFDAIRSISPRQTRV
jgi:glycosyltransferase involved in cell wall biosynthesis